MVERTKLIEAGLSNTHRYPHSDKESVEKEVRKWEHILIQYISKIKYHNIADIWESDKT